MMTRKFLCRSLVVLVSVVTPWRGGRLVYSQNEPRSECVVNADTGECPTVRKDEGRSKGEDDLFSNLADFLQNTVFGQSTGESVTDPFAFFQNNNDNSNDSSSPGGGIGDILRDLANIIQGEQPESPSESNKQQNQDSPVGKKRDTDHLLADLITAAASTHSKEESLSIQALMDLFLSSSKRVHDQLERTFKDQLVDLSPIQLYYHMLREESEKDAVWKRRQARFLPAVDEATATIPMADGLFLSQLAYMNTCEQINEQLKSFHQDSWAMLNCTTSGKPAEPAHFLAIRKVAQPLQEEKNFWQQTKDLLFNADNKEGVLEVALVVRGSKELADFISDGMLEAVDFRGGKAHDGVLQSGKWLYNEYKLFLQDLLALTGRRKLKLWLVGHSLGAGTAALACMHFNEDAKHVNNSDDVVNKPNTRIEAYSIGFGTPAVVSKEMSEASKPTITTVINDADCIPRMSGSSLVNTWRKAGSYDGWIDDTKQDVEFVARIMKENLPFPSLTETIMNGIFDFLEKQRERLAPGGSQQHNAPATQVLFPPGECVHLFRDGTGWQAVYKPCDQFNEIEAVRHLVSDHLIDTGYYRGLLGYIREIKNDMNWKFEPDLMKLRV